MAQSTGPRICLVGVGLIAGSLGLALRGRPEIGEVIGLGRHPEQLQRAVAHGAVDRVSVSAADALADVDIVVLGVPLGAIRTVMAEIRPHLPEQAVITDVGSAKGCVVADVEAEFGGPLPRFVPGHPIAGTEHSGVEAAFGRLFVDRRVILTPTPQTDEDALERVQRLWAWAGARVVTMSVDHHDRMLAMTSHLPHMLAFGLVDSLASDPSHEEIFRYAAGGFRDFTRIASSDPVMWRDICLGNRGALLEALAAYRGDLEQLTALIEAADGEGLEGVFRNAKQIRDGYLQWFEDRVDGD